MTDRPPCPACGKELDKEELARVEAKIARAVEQAIEQAIVDEQARAEAQEAPTGGEGDG